MNITEKVDEIMSKCSTCTIMVYTNFEFYFKRIFTDLYVTTIFPIPLTKKQKNVDKRKLKVPRGSIIGLRHGNSVRGIFLGKKKKKICSKCCSKVTMSFDFKKTKSVNIFDDVQILNYICPQCSTVYTGKLEYFLNQVTILLSLGGPRIVNVMLFKDSIKIAGCKSEKDAKTVITILWEKYLLPMASSSSKIKRDYYFKRVASQPNPYFTIKQENNDDNEKTMKFVFETVMKNMDFHLGFSVNREKLNILMNSKKYNKKVYMSNFDPTGQTNVNIKMFMNKPDNFK
jgi:ribosomal protein S27AE